MTDTPLPPGSTQKTFRTEKERAEAAIAAFQAVADKYSGSVADKAKYFVAVNRLSIDRAAGMQDLQGMANTSSPVGKLAMFALAQAKADDGKVDEAVELYKQLDAQDEPLISKETIEFELAKLYEKQGRKQDAAELLFSIV